MKNQIKLGILYILLIVLVLLPSTLSSEDPIGYEIINNTYLHVWNQGQIEPNYYYENNCLSQISNILGEQWETVTKYLGIYQNNQFIMYEWGSQLPCTREDNSDFETYSNNSATTEINNINLKMNSHIKTNDNMITQIYEFNAPIQTNSDIWFLLESNNISIAGDQENDFLKVKKINGEEELYNLNNTNEIWVNSSNYQPFYFITDIKEGKNILSSWNNNDYEWKIRINKNISLFINLGKVNTTTKYFEKQWVDAACMCFGISEITSDINWTEGNETNVGNNLTMSCRFDITQGLGTCSGCAGLYRDDQMGTQRTIPTNANSSDILECNVLGQCGEKDIFYNGTWYDKTITCNSNGTVGTNCIHEDITGVVEVSSGIRYITCNLINESEARQAIEEGINNTALNGEIIKTDQQIYIRYLDNTQSLGYFDKFTSKDNQTWVFNYVNSSETFTNITSLGNTVNVWENSSLTYSQIVEQVESFINETLI